MKTVAIGIVQAVNGIYHFSPKQIFAAVRAVGICNDKAAEVVGELLRAANRAESGAPDPFTRIGALPPVNSLAPVRRFDCDGGEVA